MCTVLSFSVTSDSWWPHGLCSPGSCPWGFSRQEYWSGLPFPSPGDLPDPRIEPRSPPLQVDSLPSEPPGSPSTRQEIILWGEDCVFIHPLCPLLAQCLTYSRHVISEWVSESHSVVSDSLWPHGSYSPWNSPGQNTGVGSLSLLQGIFPTQGSNPGLPHFRRILHQLSHKGIPRILEWVAYPFSSSFPTRESNQGLLHCRRILYHLSYQALDKRVLNSEGRTDLGLYMNNLCKSTYFPPQTKRASCIICYNKIL